VLTTINLPTVLEEYQKNAHHYGHHNILCVVIGDRKSPAQSKEYVAGISSPDFEIHYLGVAEQEEWLRPYPGLSRLLPYDSVQRRNIGYLVAAELGAEVLISIDDDNFPLLDYDYFGEHGLVGSTFAGASLNTTSGWFNSCSLLDTEPSRPIYHRGYPISQRWKDGERVWGQCQSELLVNVGLWLGDPDVDTITRLEQPLVVTGVQHARRRFALAPALAAPFNSQNTAFHVKLLAAMFLPTVNDHERMLRGNNNFRYDDIWMSYFIKLICDHLQGVVAIGPPHVRQDRNAHDYLLDLEKEMFPMRMTDRFPQLLPRFVLKGQDAFQCYGEIADQLPALAKQVHYAPSEVAVLTETAQGMRVWLEAVSTLGARQDGSPSLR
jgi:hypothetical protein